MNLLVHPGNEILVLKKKNKLSSYEKAWRNPKYIFLSERSQTEKATYCMIPTMWKMQNYGDSKRITLFQGFIWEEG